MRTTFDKNSIISVARGLNKLAYYSNYGTTSYWPFSVTHGLATDVCITCWDISHHKKINVIFTVQLPLFRWSSAPVTEIKMFHNLITQRAALSVSRQQQQNVYNESFVWLFWYCRASILALLFIATSFKTGLCKSLFSGRDTSRDAHYGLHSSSQVAELPVPCISLLFSYLFYQTSGQVRK